MKVYLIRHAHAGERDPLAGDDRLRPLSDRGRRQADGLVVLLQDAIIERVLSSPYVRCMQTVTPLAQVRGLVVEPEPVLAEGSDWHDTIELAVTSAVPIALCSQGDVIGDLVGDLVTRGLIRPGDARASKASTWVLEVERGAVQAANYLPPPAE